MGGVFRLLIQRPAALVSCSLARDVPTEDFGV
jgi:hypothetical protein